MKYQVIYADPPWSYDKKVGIGIADDYYQTMLTEDLKKLDIGSMASDNSVLLMWATFPMLKEALEVIVSWGFEYKIAAFVWVKMEKNGRAVLGLGHYTRGNSEICILARKGRGLEIKNHSISQIVFSLKDKHSKKPHAVYSRIEKLFGNVSRVELFARHKREGWDAWGNEVPKDTQQLISSVVGGSVRE
jgi:N6-adenosine-specific RNA methylase IME4